MPIIGELGREIRERSTPRRGVLQHPGIIYKIASGATAGGLLFGYGTAIINGAIIAIERDHRLTDLWKELIIGSTLFAAALTSIITGSLADSIGRKRIIIIASLIFSLGSIVMALSIHDLMLLLGRILIGVAIGMVSCSVPVYVAECSPKEIRGFLVSFNQLFITIGLLMASMVAAVLHSFPQGWRIMFGFGAVPALVQLYFFLRMPESPRFMVMKGRYEKAEKTLKLIRPSGCNIEHEIEEIKASVEVEQDTLSSKGCVTICKSLHVRRALIVGCMLQMFQQFCGINSIIFYSSTILINAGFPPDKAVWWSVVPFLANFLATFPGLWAVEKFGRKPVLIISFVACAISCGVLAAGFVLGNRHSPTTDPFNDPLGSYGQCADYKDCYQCVRMSNNKCGYCAPGHPDPRREGACVKLKLERFKTHHSVNGRCAKNNSNVADFALMSDGCPSEYSWLPLLGLILFVLAYAPGVGPIPWTINAEIYPIFYRSVANSIATFTNWTCNGIVTMTFLTMANAFKDYGIFIVYLAVSLTGAIFVVLYVPETTGLSLEEIQYLFMGERQSETYSRIRQSHGLPPDFIRGRHYYSQVEHRQSASPKSAPSHADTGERRSAGPAQRSNENFL